MRLALLNLTRHHARTGLSILGVGVGVAAIVAFSAMGEGFKRSIDRLGRDSGADLVLVDEAAGDPSFGRISREQIEALRADPDLRSVSRSMAMPAAMPGRSVPMLVIGRDPAEELIATFRTPALRGRLIESVDEVMLGELAAADLGLGLGDELQLFQRSLRVVGIYRTAISFENGGAVVHARLLEEVLAMPEGSAQVVFVFLRDEESLPLVTLRLTASMPGVRVLPTALLASSFEQLAYVDSFIWVISLAALLVGAIGVLNTMLMSVAERTREIGTLRAFGWSGRKVMRLILQEGMATSVAGGVVGLILGVLGAEALMRLVPQGLLVPAYTPAVFLRGMVVALSLGALGAFYPAWRASRLPPAEALRYE